MSQPNSDLTIERFTLGDWQTNCYVVHAGEDAQGRRPCWFVDAGFDPQPMLDYVKDERLWPTQVVLTHAHLDHIAGLHAVRDAYPDIPILIHEAERHFLTDTMLNLSAGYGMPIVAPEATSDLRHGEVLDLNHVGVEVRHTPGHSPGSVSLVQHAAGVAIVGDALFAGSVGRVDFPTSDGPLLIRSIHEQLLTLPDATQVLPGHGPATTIGGERRLNPYLQGELPTH